ncbi:MAG: hypothetical protein JO284_13290 [Planctomycetaceae bacterium]|nr:hypothetical protein [Planctomycetaceae bacterium]
MTFACLALLALVGLGEPKPDASELVARLASEQPAERAAAAEALGRMGQDALPALREVRARASALIDAIENQQLVQPTLVTLDFRERPLSEVVDAISKRSEMTLALVSEGAPDRPRRPITLQAPEPVTFWTALDRLCQAGGLRVVPPSEAWQLPARRIARVGGGPVHLPRPMPGSELILAPDDGRGTGPVADFGVFRVALIGLHMQRDRLFFQNPQTTSGEPVTSRFVARVQVQVEPRLTLSWDAKPVVLEARDDKGQSLLPDPSPAISRGPRPVLQFGARPDLLDIPLNYPERPGKTIIRLRGMLPAMITGRRPDPLVVPLEGAPGKTFRSEEATLTVHEVKAVPNQPGLAVDLTLTLQGAPIPSGPGAGPRPASVATTQAQLEFLDGKGRVCQSFVLGPARLGDGIRRTLQVAPGPDGGMPVSVRHYGSIRAKVEVPFEFRDLPMP